MFVEVVLIRLTKEIRTSELGTMFLQVSVVAVNQLNVREVIYRSKVTNKVKFHIPS